jgi:prolyl 4-hydroxylase
MSWLHIALALSAFGAGAYGVYALRIRLNRRRYRVREFPEFLTPEECDHIIERARPVMEESKVISRRRGNEKKKSFVRTSESGYLPHERDPVIRSVKKRIGELAGHPVENQEKLQVTHYFPFTFYSPHFDALIKFKPEAGNRICTVIVYLNDDFTGGDTNFPRVGLRIRPEKGKAVLFSNLSEDGKGPNRLAVHEAKIVHSGEKWILNQWIREHRYKRGGQKSAKTGSRQRFSRKRR